MSLRWKKDGVTTLFLAALAVVAWASYQGWDWPVVSSARVVAVLALVVGLVIGSVGGMDTYATRPDRSILIRRLFLAYVAVAVLLTVAVLIWPRHSLLGALCGLVGLLWLVTTLWRAFAKSAEPTAASKPPKRAKPRKPWTSRPRTPSA